MSTRSRVGLVGCGDISRTYLSLAPTFAQFEIVACADLRPEAAGFRAVEYGIEAEADVDALLARDDIDIILNLTIPAAHAAVTKSAIDAGKHVYSEKPLALSVDEARALGDAAGANDLRVGCAPDTFLGAAQQASRNVVDSGVLGSIAGGAAYVMGPGMENWHPNPSFFFQKGGGPIFDMGPYYLTALVNLLGPIAEVGCLSASPRAERVSTRGPAAGRSHPVETPTTLHSVLAFENGAVVSFGASWDVASHGHSPIEIYGLDATLAVPDPNFFGGQVVRTPLGGEPESLTISHPFGIENEGPEERRRVNYRGAGLADMAAAIHRGAEHRCALSLATHVVDAMSGILEAADSRKIVALTTTGRFS